MPSSRFLWQIDGSGGRAVPVEVRWSSRRRSRMGFSCNADGGVLVEAPCGTTTAQVQGVLRRHARWIRRQSEAARENGGVGYPSEYRDGTCVHYRGEPLALCRSDVAEASLHGGRLVVPREGAKAAVWAWYARQADAVLGRALAGAAARLAWVATPPPWCHRFMRSRWGSCSASGRIALNTHLVKLHDELIEYVVVHELCHLRHLHHGPAFQRLLGESLPDWPERRRVLHRHGGLLREPLP